MRSKTLVQNEMAACILVVQSLKFDFSPEGNRAFLNAMRECNRLRDELYAIDRHENDQQVEQIAKAMGILKPREVWTITPRSIKRSIRPSKKQIGEGD